MMNGDLTHSAGIAKSEACDESNKLLPWAALSRAPIIVQSVRSANFSVKNRNRYRAGPQRKLRRRAVLKSGECNVLQSRISKRSLRFLQDIFTTLVDSQWRWTLLSFALSFVLSWLGFAGIWWLIAFTHGDFEGEAEAERRPCVLGLESFASCFLFSIETQHTIGYGGRATTEDCPEAIFVMCIQSISGMMIQAFMVGIVFAKMSRPRQRTQTLLFSRNAVVCQRDGELCLMFRVGDMRKSHIVGASVRAQLIRSRTTREGELLAHSQRELALGADAGGGELFFIWPCTVVHRIAEGSPFYGMSAEELLQDRFEIVVILEGTIESTGQTTQARSSYLPQEVLWGHRFEPMLSYSKERQGYEVDYSLFDSTVPVDTPLCSGRDLAEFHRLQDELHQRPPVYPMIQHEPRCLDCSDCSRAGQPARFDRRRRRRARGNATILACRSLAGSRRALCCRPRDSKLRHSWHTTADPPTRLQRILVHRLRADSCSSSSSTTTTASSTSSYDDSSQRPMFTDV